jgi:hypothetical protein
VRFRASRASDNPTRKACRSYVTARWDWPGVFMQQPSKAAGRIVPHRPSADGTLPGNQGFGSWPFYGCCLQVLISQFFQFLVLSSSILSFRNPPFCLARGTDWCKTADPSCA